MMLTNMIGKALVKKGIYMAADVVLPGSSVVLKGADMLFTCGMTEEKLLETVSKRGLEGTIELCGDLGEMKETVTDAVIGCLKDLF